MAQVLEAALGAHCAAWAAHFYRLARMLHRRLVACRRWSHYRPPSRR